MIVSISITNLLIYVLIDEPVNIRMTIGNDQKEEYHAWHCSFENGWCGIAKSKTMRTTSGGFGNGRGPTGKSAKGTGINNLHLIFSCNFCRCYILLLL